MTETITYINKKNGTEITTELNDRVDEILNKKGYIRKGFKDEDGVLRHFLSRADLTSIDNGLTSLLSNISTKEKLRYSDAFTELRTLIHKLTQER